jgi:hypothetical protein
VPGQGFRHSSQPKIQLPSSFDSAFDRRVRFSIVRYERHSEVRNLRGAAGERAPVGHDRRHAPQAEQSESTIFSLERCRSGGCLFVSAVFARIAEIAVVSKLVVNSHRKHPLPYPGILRAWFRPMVPIPANLASERSASGLVSTATSARKSQPIAIRISSAKFASSDLAKRW